MTRPSGNEAAANDKSWTSPGTGVISCVRASKKETGEPCGSRSGVWHTSVVDPAMRESRRTPRSPTRTGIAIGATRSAPLTLVHVPGDALARDGVRVDRTAGVAVPGAGDTRGDGVTTALGAAMDGDATA